MTYGIMALVLLGIALFAVVVRKGSPLILLAPAAPLALLLLTSLTLKRQWEHWTFRVTRETLEMSHGWLWKQRRVVARDRIQHVDFNSGPFDRKFGLVQVVVHTAGTSVGMIPGVALERAQQLRDELLSDRPPA